MILAVSGLGWCAVRSCSSGAQYAALGTPQPAWRASCEATPGAARHGVAQVHERVQVRSGDFTIGTASLGSEQAWGQSAFSHQRTGLRNGHAASFPEDDRMSEARRSHV
jgi:hypothetical protein